MLLGMYVPGTSLLHKASAGVKLVALAVLLLVLAVERTPVGVGIMAAVTVLLAAVSGVGGRALLAQLRPLLWVVVVLGALQVWLSGPVAALVVVGSLVVATGLAALLTLTTPVQDILDAVVTAIGPLRRFGVDPERVALVLALTIRSIPVIAALAAEVSQARKARGAERSLRAFAVPLVIRTIRHADRLGEALAARGLDD
jgi:biotin transport system permease protein